MPDYDTRHQEGYEPPDEWVLKASDCLEFRTGQCEGPVEFRASMSGTGTPMKRCDFHQDKRLEKQTEHNKAYPDSPIAPSWFDPSYAGERWNDDY